MSMDYRALFAAIRREIATRKLTVTEVDRMAGGNGYVLHSVLLRDRKLSQQTAISVVANAVSMFRMDLSKFADMQTIGGRIEYLQIKNGLTSKMFAKKISCAEPSVVSWKSSRSYPTEHFIVKISKEFNVTVDFIVGMDDLDKKPVRNALVDLVEIPKQVELDAVIEAIDDAPETFEFCHTNQTDVKTMLSTEIVKIINDMREEGAAELLHKNFTVKIVKVLGEEHSAKFLAQYKDRTGRTLNCYALPKRESELMVMSESYKVQAAVYDRMTELAEKVIEQPTPQQTVQIAPITAEFESALALARMCGLENNQAVLGANKMVKKMTNVDVLEMLGSPALISPTNERFFNVTTLAMALGKSAISLNRELEQKGFQVKTGDLWTATEKGKPFSVLQDVGKSHSNGTPIQQLKWFESIKAELVD